MEERFIDIGTTEEFGRYKGYRVSNLGRVQTAWRQHGAGRGVPPVRYISSEWRDMDGYRQANGYRFVTLCGGLHPKTVKAAVLVLSAFVGPRSRGIVCRHLDGDTSNDSLANLAWGTQAENKADELLTGRRCRGERHHNRKLTEPQAREIYRRAVSGENQHDLAKEFGIGNSNVSMIKHRQAWQHIHVGSVR